MRGYWGDLRGFGPETSRAKSFASRAPVSLRWQGGSPRGGGLRKGGRELHMRLGQHIAHMAPKGAGFPLPGRSPRKLLRAVVVRLLG